MRWEELTSDQFPEAVKQAQGVCLVPLSVVERHGHHLPMGTDTFIGREICRRAAEIEPAVIFPDFIFTQILEAQHQPGTIAIEPELMLKLLDNICREIARNGLKKIVLVMAHGGNAYLAPFFAQTQLATPRDYVVYVAQPPFSADEEAALRAQFTTSLGDHAGETETSAVLAVRPDLVHMDRIVAGEGKPQGRLNHINQVGAYTSIWWYADYPHHYSDDAQPATAEKGDLYLTYRASALARLVRVVKDDQETLRLQNEFFARRTHG